MNDFKKIVNILPAHDLWKFQLLFLLLLVIAALEVVGLALLAPYLSVLAGNPLNTIPFASAILPWLPHVENRTLLIRDLSIVLIVFYMGRFLVLTAGAYWQARVTYGSQADLAKRLVETYFSLPYEQFIRRSSAEYTRNAVLATNQVFAGVVTAVLTIAADAAVIAALLGALFFIDPAVMAVLVVVLAVFGTLYSRAVRGPLIRFGEAQNYQAQRLLAHINNLFSGMKELKVTRVVPAFVRELRVTLDKYTDALCIGSFLNLLPRAVLETTFVASLAFLVLAVLLTGRSLEQTIPLVTAIAAAGLRIAPGLTRIASYGANMRFYWPALLALDQELRRLGRIESKEAEAVLKDEAFEWHEGCRIAFDNVSYTYPDASATVVNGVTFEIPFGSRVGFVGPTGSGKSTVLDLILGIVEPSGGEILVSKKPLRRVLNRWWSHVAYVPQSIFLLDDSIERNVAFDLTSRAVDRVRLDDAIRHARLEGFLEHRSKTLREERVGDRGAMLSGGERQRIGLARALYRGSDVIVLDEATSALDSENERKIVDALFALDRSKTLIFVAHRLSTIERCDIIFVIQNGRIVRQGTFASLGLGKSGGTSIDSAEIEDDRARSA